MTLQILLSGEIKDPPNIPLLFFRGLFMPIRIRVNFHSTQFLLKKKLFCKHLHDLFKSEPKILGYQSKWLELFWESVM